MTTSRGKRLLFGAILSVGLPVLALLVLEGSTSIWMFVRDFRNAQAPRVVRPNTTYDTLLGWVNKPSASSPDEYGKGIGLATNAMGFRGSDVVNPADSSVTRLECVGASTTLGYGVSDNQTWCHLLEPYFPGLQALNLGQEAYGLDQAFLRYQRDGVRVPHRVLLFAINDVQFDRTVVDNFEGRFKPLMAIKDNKLSVVNVPIPHQTDASLRRAAAGRLINDLRIMKVIRSIKRFDGTARAAARVDSQWPLFERMLDEVGVLTKAANVEYVMVYLPTRANFFKNARQDSRRDHLTKYAQEHHVRFVDLTLPLRATRPDSVDIAFISKVPPGAAPGVGGHFSSMGNAWAAREIAAQIADIPALGKLKGKASSPRAHSQ